jgi:hypothetical protein
VDLRALPGDRPESVFAGLIAMRRSAVATLTGPTFGIDRR